MRPQQVLQVGHEAGVEQRIGEPRVDAAGRWRVVRDHHRGTGVDAGQPGVEPCRLLPEQRDRVVRREEIVRGFTDTDPAEVAQEPPGCVLCGRALRRVVRQLEVRPESGAEESHAVDDGLAVVEHMHLRPLTQALELVEGALDAAAVELVVAGHIEDRLVEPHGPLCRFAGPRDVAGEHDRVRIVDRPLHGTKPQVQVGQDVQLHGRTGGAQLAGAVGGMEESPDGVVSRCLYVSRYDV